RGKCPRCGKPVEAPEDGTAGADRSAKPGSGARPTFETAGRDDDLSFLAPPREPGELGRLGDYRILKVLGQGGMGIVLLAEDVNLKRPVALKIMKQKMARSEENRLRFRREAQAAAAIEHDHIVTIYQVG